MKRQIGAGALAATALGCGALLWWLRQPLGNAWDIWRAGKDAPAALADRQRRRLRELVGFARTNSAYYREQYRDLPADLPDLSVLPVVTKPELMAHFDEWMTDPAVRRTGVESFLADPATIGERYLDRFAVWTTSGTTGRPGIFVHDPDAVVMYNLIGMLRAISVMRLVTRQQLLRLLRHGSRNALLAVTGGHFVGASETERLRRHAPRWIANAGRIFSVLQPLPDLVRALNAFQPNRIGGYPTAMAVLAQEQSAGRLRIHPSMLTPAGESLSDPMRRRLEAAFGCPVRMGYAASEFLALGFECPSGWLHINADWVILEPVDGDYRPVPPGTRSYTVLLTNLANHVAPLIRYDLGDSITVKPDPCPCGCRLPAIHVEGRAADLLRFEAAGGSTVTMLPLAIGTVVEETPGVRRCQIIQTGQRELTVRLEVAVGANGTDRADDATTWEAVKRRLVDFLGEQGAPPVTLVRDAQLPQPDPVSGKFRQVWSMVPAAQTTSVSATGSRDEVDRVKEHGGSGETRT
ncbi:MAG TPA: phenylacetate--CoA ligase family protein [Ktedonobacterales bacterium]|nr:phenylacetate--CoA ligase family protein [Ktedonobacterales bacterium]